MIRPGAAATLCALAVLSVPGLARAQMDMPGHVGHAAAAESCADAALACARTATPAFAPDGTLYVAWATSERVALAGSADNGAHFGPQVMINAGPETIDSGPDSRVGLVIDRTGRITLAYAIFRDRRYNGEVRTTSAQRGVAFPPPRPITADTSSERFTSLAVDPSDGRVFATWLDKRNRATLREQGRDASGASLAWSWTDATGTRFNEARIAVDNTCECCRLGIAFAGPGRPVVMFRNIFPGSVRDHAVIAFADADTPGPPHRVADDEWVIAACPHHGPSFAIDGAGNWHAAWFTLGRNRKGVFYARSTDQGESFSAPMPIGTPERQAGRPALLAIGDKVWLAWKEFDGEQSRVQVIASSDGGAHFSAPRIVAIAAGGSDHPILVANGATPFLSWLSQTEGYRLIALESTP